MSDLQVIDASPEQRADIERLQDALGAPDCHAAETRFGLLVHPDGTNLPLPEPLLRVLMSAANSLQAGYQVIVAPVHHKLTTQEAADLLNVSRTYLVRLLDNDTIPSSRVGRHRRVTFGDLMEYKKLRMGERRKALENLIHESEELGLYDKPESGQASS
jgi:excisionase family DNA binding protein